MIFEGNDQITKEIWARKVLKHIRLQIALRQQKELSKEINIEFRHFKPSKSGKVEK